MTWWDGVAREAAALQEDENLYLRVGTVGKLATVFTQGKRGASILLAATRRTGRGINADSGY
ncbi:hypothetical protein GL4_0311 [Methyloceanibacter caenitepidi]|uniref:Uncharacterized protein n=1 Tax=Methyloceanibacter caenitepidi TaxID=1384459 RepID=A0A0A8JZD2_9HYPH|nr:hypothetical protein GL4_0311 [Methyloceanibacter caenitepidi]